MDQRATYLGPIYTACIKIKLLRLKCSLHRSAFELFTGDLYCLSCDFVRLKYWLCTDERLNYLRSIVLPAMRCDDVRLEAKNRKEKSCHWLYMNRRAGPANLKIDCSFMCNLIHGVGQLFVQRGPAYYTAIFSPRNENGQRIRSV